MIIPFSSVVVRRSCLIEAGLFNEQRRAADDYDLWLRVGRIHEIEYVDEVLLEYRAATGGSIGSRMGNLFQITKEIQNDFVREYYGGKYPNPKAVALGMANRYAVLGDYHLAHDRQLRALGAHLCALRYDRSSPRRFFNVLRSLIPNQCVAVLKRVFRYKIPVGQS